MILEKMEHDDADGGPLDLEDLKEELLAHICSENKAFFKHQQINEPELTYEDRRTIASEILGKSHSKFLQRFGMSMKKDHLQFFELQTYQEPEQDEVNENLKNIRYNLDNHNIIVRNRRYAALVKLIKDKKYFSESEMKDRDPLLYEQLIGQFQSADAKRANRRPDPKTDTLVDVLLEGIDHDFNREVEKRQRAEEEEMLEIDEDSRQTAVEAAEDDSDSDENHEQWGNFEEPAPSTSTSKARKRPAKLITAGERDLLSEEFLGVMYSNFLSGKDTEFFDYSTVDDNEEYDDTFETNQDCEDKYFEDLSEDSPAQQIDDGSEDELDVYMRHLEKNLKQQEFQEEFDDD